MVSDKCAVFNSNFISFEYGEPQTIVYYNAVFPKKHFLRSCPSRFIYIYIYPKNIAFVGV